MRKIHRDRDEQYFLADLLSRVFYANDMFPLGEKICISFSLHPWQNIEHGGYMNENDLYCTL